MPEENNSNSFVPPQTDGTEPIAPQEPPVQPAPTPTNPPVAPPPATSPPITPPPLETPPTQAQPPQTPVKGKIEKPKKKIWAKVIIIVVIVIAVSGAAYGAWFGYQTYMGDDSESIFWQAMENYSQQQKMEISGDAKITLAQMNDRETEGESNIINDLLTSSDSNVFEVSFTNKFDKTSTNKLSQTKIDVSWNKLALGSIETKQIGNDYFAKPTLSPDNMFISMGDFELPDQWVEIYKESLNDTLQTYNTNIGNSLDSRINTQKFIALAKENKPFTVEVLEKDDMSLGQTAYLYNLTFDKVGFENTMMAYINTVSDQDEKLYLQTRYQNMDAEEWSKIANTKITVWVTSSDKQMKKMALLYKNESSGFSIQSTLNFKTLEEELSFSRPTNTITAEGFLEDVVSNFMEETEEKAGDEKTIEDIEMLQAALDQYFSDNDEYPLELEFTLNDSIQLCSIGGLIDKDKLCTGTAYVDEVPTNPVLNYIYSSEDGTEYAIVFMLLEDQGDLKKGINIATPEGMEAMEESSIDIEELEQMYLEGKLDEEEDEDEEVIEEEEIMEEEPVAEENDEEEVVEEEEEQIFNNNEDTDGDGLSDEEETEYGTNYLLSDTDEDGLSDYEEVMNWDTNPTNPDTDGDGFNDYEELNNGYDPNGPGKLEGWSDDEEE